MATPVSIEYFSNYVDPEHIDNSGYEDLIAAFGMTVLHTVELGRYSGDTLVFFHHTYDDLYAFLTFGWGSCPGCDALQACGSYQDTYDLYLELYGGLRWFQTPAEAITFFDTHDWQGEYYSDADELSGFIQSCKNTLNEQAVSND